MAEGKSDGVGAASMSDGFEDFWRVYPRKVGKLAALKEWQKHKPPTDTVLKALTAQVPQWTDPKFIPHPRTWLHQGRWMDEGFTLVETPTICTLCVGGWQVTEDRKAFVKDADGLRVRCRCNPRVR